MNLASDATDAIGKLGGVWNNRARRRVTRGQRPAVLKGENLVL